MSASQANVSNGIIFSMPGIGWDKVHAIRRDIIDRAAKAQSEHDCQGVGHLCRECIITLANAVFDSTRHATLDGKPASATDAKRKLEAYIAAELPGAGRSAELRSI